MQNRIFSEQLAALMRERGVNQVALAQAIGTSQSTISRALKGKAPKAGDLERLARYFEVTTDRLLRGKNWIQKLSSTMGEARDAAQRIEESPEPGNQGLDEVIFAEARGADRAKKEIARELRRIIASLDMLRELADRLDPEYKAAGEIEKWGKKKK